MLRRLVLDNWHQLISVLSFALTASAFIILVIGISLAKKETIEHAAYLPLQPDDSHEKE
jgi:hypothetical protein